MNEIALKRTADKFAEAIKKEGLTNKQVSQITGINYFYIGKASSVNEFHKAPKWTMEYLRDWINTGEPITRANWHKLSKDFKQAQPDDSSVEKIIKNSIPKSKIEKSTPSEFIDKEIKEEPESFELIQDETIDFSEIKNLETLPSSTVNNLKMLLEMRDKINQTINELKTIIDKWEQ